MKLYNEQNYSCVILKSIIDILLHCFEWGKILLFDIFVLFLFIIYTCLSGVHIFEYFFHVL